MRNYADRFRVIVIAKTMQEIDKDKLTEKKTKLAETMQEIDKELKNLKLKNLKKQRKKRSEQSQVR